MDFKQVIDEVFARLDREQIRYALIGGFAMAMRGVQRATVDLDILLLRQDLDRADEIMLARGYQLAFRSDNVSHYRAAETQLGRVDVLHAFRGPSLAMLERAERLEVWPGTTLPVAQVEDIIGLKIQAAYNDKERADQDWLDIQSLVRTARASQQSLDEDLINDYLSIFGQEHRLADIKAWYDPPE